MKLRPWNDDAPATAEEARERIIDAAERCFERYGPAKTTIPDIATEAGASRATVYRTFAGGRDEIVLAVMLRAGRTFMARLLRRVRRQPTMADALVEGIAYTVEETRRRPQVASLFAAGDSGAIAGASEAMFDLVREYMEAVVAHGESVGDRLRDGLDLDDATEIEWRLSLSLLTDTGPRQKDGKELRRFIRLALVPALVAGADRYALS